MSRPEIQGVFGFEQEAKDAQLVAANAKLAEKALRAIRKRQAEIDKSARQRRREQIRKEKTPDQVTLCGIGFFTRSPLDRARGSYWKTMQSLREATDLLRQSRRGAGEAAGMQTRLNSWLTVAFIGYFEYQKQCE